MEEFCQRRYQTASSPGAHPGLSDEEDCTFRLHLVLLTARFFLRQLDTTVLRGQP